MKFTRSLLSAVLLLASSALAQVFTVADVGINMKPTGVNIKGQVVGIGGDCDTCNGISHALLWSKAGGLKNLGTLPGGTFSFAYGINDLGDVVGLSDTPKGCCHATVWLHTGKIRDLGTFGGLQSLALSINNDGQVVGEADSPAGCCRAFLWTASTGHKQNLGLLKNGGTAIASSIGQFGTVVGTAFNTDLACHAFIWTKTGGMRDIGIKNAGATAINNGHVVGVLNCLQVDSDISHGYLWTQQTGMRDLGTLPGQKMSTPNAINSKVQIVGYSGQFDEGGLPFQPFAFFWTPTSGGMQNLNDLVNAPGWQLFTAVGINANTQIVGFGTLNGDPHGFLLTVVPKNK